MGGECEQRALRGEERFQFERRGKTRTNTGLSDLAAAGGAYSRIFDHAFAVTDDPRAFAGLDSCPFSPSSHREQKECSFNFAVGLQGISLF
ncbi:hypothetical protein GN956_G18441 [Arapaima gigas]